MSSDPKKIAVPDIGPGTGIRIGLARVAPAQAGDAPMGMLSIDLGKKTLCIQLDVGGVLQLASQLLSFATEITVEQLEKADKKKENPREF